MGIQLFHWRYPWCHLKSLHLVDDVTGDSQHTDDTIKKWLNVCGVLPWGKKNGNEQSFACFGIDQYRGSLMPITMQSTGI